MYMLSQQSALKKLNKELGATLSFASSWFDSSLYFSITFNRPEAIEYIKKEYAKIPYITMGPIFIGSKLTISVNAKSFPRYAPFLEELADSSTQAQTYHS